METNAQKIRMDVFSLPDVKYRVKILNGSQYRVPMPCDDPKVARLRDWKAPVKAQSRKHAVRLEDQDEPAYQICGIENPFAGIYDDDEDNEAINEKGLEFRDGLWIYVFEVSHHHHLHVFGKDMKRLRSLEKSSSCRIKIVDQDTVRIEASNKANVLHAGMYISDRLKTSKLRYTHFLCFPLTNSKELIKTVNTIQSQVKNEFMHHSALKSTKLHFTIGLLNLSQESDLEAVKEVLSSFEAKLSRKIRVELVGVQCVQENASKARVVYTGGRGGDNTWRRELLHVSRDLITELERRGLIDTRRQRNLISESNNVQLHATLFNSKYALGTEDDDSDSERESDDRTNSVSIGSEPEKRSRFFDATAFMDKYKDMIFGSVDVDEIRLCSLVGNPNGSEDDGFYKTEFAVKL